MCKIQTPFEIEPFENPPLPKAREQLIKLAHLKQRWGAGALLCAKVQKTFSRGVLKSFQNSVSQSLDLGWALMHGRCVGFIHEKCFSIKQHYYGVFKQISCVCLNKQCELLKAWFKCEWANYLMKSLCFCIWMRGHFKRGLGCRRNVSSRSSCSQSALSLQAFPSLTPVWQASLC